MSLERHLVLNRWLSRRLGAEDLRDIEGDFQLLEPGVDGETPFLRTLLSSERVMGLVDQARLHAQVVEHEVRRGHANLLVRPDALRRILAGCEILVDDGEEREPRSRVMEPAFVDRGLTMSGWIVTNTERGDIPDAGDLTWNDLGREHRVPSQLDGACVERVRSGPS